MAGSDIFEVTNPELISRLENINNGTLKDIVISGQTREIATNVTGTLSGGELANIIEPDGYYVPINDGQVNFMHYEGTNFVDAPTTSTTAIQKSVPAGPITQYNSNTTAIQRGRVTQAYNTSVSNGKVNLSSTPKSGSFGANAAYLLGEVNQAVLSAQIGIMLGKVIDGALYNANPDYWDSIGMSTLNPETWSSLTHGDDSFGAALFNMVFGIDPDTNTGQAYIDEEAFAYIAQVLAQNGWFASGQPEAVYNGDTSQFDLPNVVSVYPQSSFTIARGTSTVYEYIANDSDGVFVTGYNESNNSQRTIYFTTNPQGSYTQNRGSSAPVYNANISGQTYNGTTYYYSSIITPYSNETANTRIISFSYPNNDYPSRQIATILFDGTIVQPSSIDGVSNQPNATLPNTSTWADQPTTLQSLKDQYPNIWNNGIKYDQLQPDGTLKEHTYVPVGWPSTNVNPWTDTQPVTNVLPITQVAPQVDLDNLPNDETSPLTRTLTQPTTTTPDPTVPQNPSDTGSGSTPTPSAPTGNASALWSVYHPTQAQINSFGAWLWGSVFTTDIRKLFEDPIQGVISLHKVFAPPVDSGSGNIVVGTLDSGVSSATVTQQYVTVDCGSVSCNEDFGSVFDYAPFTSVSLFLPFIGIVPLDVSDVMRSTIHVIYGVDVFTGACLAMVEISRDGNTVNMYQYSGVASVEYPLTNMQQSNILSGLLSIAGGVAMTVASGGVGFAAGAAMVGGAAQAANTHIGRSGGFSGNAGAMGIKKPYLIIVRPQTKVASTFPLLEGYPTNYSCKLGDCTNHVVVTHVHVEGINATDTELSQIESLLKEGVLV